MSVVLQKLGLPPWDERYVNAFNIYVVFFLGRYVSEDIKLICGSLFDHPVAKTLILFVVLFNVSKSAPISTFWTVIFLTLQWLMSRYSKCKPYIDKGPKDDLDTNIWVTNFSGSSARVAPQTFSSSSASMGMPRVVAA